MHANWVSGGKEVIPWAEFHYSRVLLWFPSWGVQKKNANDGHHYNFWMHSGEWICSLKRVCSIRFNHAIAESCFCKVFICLTIRALIVLKPASMISFGSMHIKTYISFPQFSSVDVRHHFYKYSSVVPWSSAISSLSSFYVDFPSETSSSIFHRCTRAASKSNRSRTAPVTLLSLNCQV